MLGCLFDVLDRNEADAVALIIDHDQLFDAVLMQQALRLVLGDVALHRHEVVLGHQLEDRLVEPGREADIAVGENADELAFAGAAVRRVDGAIDDGDARDALFRHQFQGFPQRLARGDRHRVQNDAAFIPFHLSDVARLLVDREVAVQDTDAAFLRHRDGEAGFGNRVHRRGQQRNIEPHGPRKLGRDVHLARHHVGWSGHEQNVVEGKRDPRIERR